jgi:lysophospholipase L1-like esterase
LLAERFGWQGTVVPDGATSGWQYAGEQRPGGRPGTFAQRLAKQPRDPAVDLVFMQGGLSDQQLAAEGGSLTTAFNDRVHDTIALARKKYPRAKIVIMGPLMPVANFEGIVPEIDDRLSLEAAQAGCYYISPHLEGWLDSPAKIRAYIDPSASNHPNTAGHAYLAQRTAAALRKLRKKGQSLEMPAS